jgi:hypothetical protein
MFCVRLYNRSRKKLCFQNSTCAAMIKSSEMACKDQVCVFTHSLGRRDGQDISRAQTGGVKGELVTELSMGAQRTASAPCRSWGGRFHRKGNIYIEAPRSIHSHENFWFPGASSPEFLCPKERKRRNALEI